LLTLCVKAVCRAIKKELVRSDVDDAVIDGLQLLKLIAKLMLADGLKAEALLGTVGKLDL
jgi:hypothetical protein